MILHGDTVTLRPDEVKLFLALALSRQAETAWTSTFVDNTVEALALSLFGHSHSQFVTSEDADRLKHEAHAEYRRG